MSAATREDYEKLPKLTEKQIYLASCPILERGKELLILDEGKLIPLEEGD